MVIIHASGATRLAQRAAQFISIIEVEEGGLPLEVGAILRTESALLPVLRNLIVHLHRAAHQASRGNTL